MTNDKYITESYHTSLNYKNDQGEEHKHNIPGVEYDIKNIDLETTRFLTTQCNGHRFRVLLEIAKGCFGNCDGCSLSTLDRRSAKPAISLDMVEKTLDYFLPMINNDPSLGTTVVNYGTGDYFMLEEDYLEGLFFITKKFFEKTKTVRNVITISTSLFLPEDKMKSRVDIFKKYISPTQIAIEGVIDPNMLEKHYDRYLANFHALNKDMPFFDCVFNVADGVEERHADLIIKFMKDAHILNLDLQYAINNTNIYRVKISQDNFSRFFKYLKQKMKNNGMDNLLTMSISIPSAPINNDEQESNDGVADVADVFSDMKKQAQGIIKERVTVDGDGDIYPLGFAYGDIILDHRYGFLPIGNINKPFNIEAAENIVFNHLKKLFLKNKPCVSCRFNRKCYSTGYAFYNNFSENSLHCDNPGRVLYEMQESKIIDD